MRNRIADGGVLELVQLFLKQDIMEDMKRWTPTSGSPQGAVISPLLAIIYLHELDVEMREAGLVMVRYADDAGVMSQSGRGGISAGVHACLGGCERIDVSPGQDPCWKLLGRGSMVRVSGVLV